MSPTAKVIDDRTIIITDPPGALGYAKGAPIYLVYVHADESWPHERRPRTVGKSTHVSPDAIAFKVVDTVPGREALEMVREELVDPVAVGARHVIELSPCGPKPTVEYVSPVEAARRRRKGR